MSFPLNQPVQHYRSDTSHKVFNTPTLGEQRRHRPQFRRWVRVPSDVLFRRRHRRGARRPTTARQRGSQRRRRQPRSVGRRHHPASRRRGRRSLCRRRSGRGPPPGDGAVGLGGLHSRVRGRLPVPQHRLRSGGPPKNRCFSGCGRSQHRQRPVGAGPQPRRHPRTTHPPRRRRRQGGHGMRGHRPGRPVLLARKGPG